MSPDRLQRGAFRERELSFALDRQHPDGLFTRHERRREGTARPDAAPGIVDESRLAALEDSRDERALRHAIPAGDHEPLVVAADDSDLIHAKATGERRSEPSQRHVERRFVRQGSLDRDQDLVSTPVAAGPRAQYSAHDSDQSQHRERHEAFHRFSRETRPLDLRKHERRAQEHRAHRRERAAAGAESQSGREHGQQIHVTEQRRRAGPFERDQRRHHRERGRDEADHAPSVRYTAKNTSALTSPGTRLSDHQRSQQLIAPRSAR